MRYWESEALPDIRLFELSYQCGMFGSNHNWISVGKSTTICAVNKGRRGGAGVSGNHGELQHSLFIKANKTVTRSKDN